MKYRVKITNLQFDVEFELIEEQPIIRPIEKPVEVPDNTLLDWKAFLDNGGGVLKAGVNYQVPEYSVYDAIDRNLEIAKDSDLPTSITFGKEGYSEWDEGPKQDKYLFNTGDNTHITIDGVSLFTAKGKDEVQPFYITIFKGAGYNQNLVLRNLNTNMQRALLYSVNQMITQVCTAENVNFHGIMWEEMKANKGGGLKSVMINCNLKQLNPRTSFEASIKFNAVDLVTSTIPFSRIESKFNGWGNSCNILFVQGMTFYLPKTDELGFTHGIRPIPKVGDQIDLEVFTLKGEKYFRTDSNSLQIRDEISVNGVKYQIRRKDRSRQKFNEKEGYFIDFFAGPIDLEDGCHKAEVLKSTGLDLIGSSFPGHMIFKYNSPFQTNMEKDHGLEYMLKSNPYGVLFYNHKEITMYAKNTKADGFYRQSKSGVGFSNGYTLIDCEGIEVNEFKPDVEVIRVEN